MLSVHPTTTVSYTATPLEPISTYLLTRLPFFFWFNRKAEKKARNFPRRTDGAFITAALPTSAAAFLLLVLGLADTQRSGRTVCRLRLGLRLGQRGRAQPPLPAPRRLLPGALRCGAATNAATHPPEPGRNNAGEKKRRSCLSLSDSRLPCNAQRGN